MADFRQRIQRLIAELTEDRPIATTLRMLGPTTGVGVGLADHADAVITEAISNTIRHSGASRLTIEVTAADQFTVDITDNGCGIPPDSQRRSGLANMAHRAEQLGGTCHITMPRERWHPCPLDRAADQGVNHRVIWAMVFPTSRTSRLGQDN